MIPLAESSCTGVNSAYSRLHGCISACKLSSTIPSYPELAKPQPNIFPSSVRIIEWKAPQAICLTECGILILIGLGTKGIHVC